MNTELKKLLSKITKKDLKGDIQNFPLEVVKKMCERQYDQFGIVDIKPFQNNLLDGFAWRESKEKSNFWVEVIHLKNFDLFFKKYPKKPTTQQAILTPDNKELLTAIVFKDIYQYFGMITPEYTYTQLSGFIVKEITNTKSREKAVQIIKEYENEWASNVFKKNTRFATNTQIILNCAKEITTLIYEHN